jgi:hypothetical protein
MSDYYRVVSGAPGSGMLFRTNSDRWDEKGAVCFQVTNAKAQDSSSLDNYWVTYDWQHFQPPRIVLQDGMDFTKTFRATADAQNSVFLRMDGYGIRVDRETHYLNVVEDALPLHCQFIRKH